MKHKHADLIHAWADGAEIQHSFGEDICHGTCVKESLTVHPTAVIAARQMRDAAAMEAYKWCAESRHVKLGDIVFKAIAALPIPGEEKCQQS